MQTVAIDDLKHASAPRRREGLLEPIQVDRWSGVFALGALRDKHANPMCTRLLAGQTGASNACLTRTFSYVCGQVQTEVNC